MKKSSKTCRECYYDLFNDHCFYTECSCCPLYHQDEHYTGEGTSFLCHCNKLADGEECHYYKEIETNTDDIVIDLVGRVISDSRYRLGTIREEKENSIVVEFCDGYIELDFLEFDNSNNANAPVAISKNVSSYIQKKINNLCKSNQYRRNNMEEKKVLSFGFSAGTRAIDNYDRCCSLFGFKRSLRGNFGQQRMLYAKNATQEGYSVWMLAHSSLNESFNRNRRWYNIFVYPDIIREIWFVPSDISASQEDHSYRVCFAKNKNGEYVFQGIYEPQKIDWEKAPDGKTELVRTFKKISQIYPMENNTAVDINTANNHTFYEPKITKYIEILNVIDGCQIKALILETNKDTSVNVDVTLRPFQKALIGKQVGDTFSLPNVSYTYQIKKIVIKE
ncbi:MAG: hypothetical protein IKJ00_04480 [Clostridia bacterium]|nr:hypothetical protein [Clostridia bacterium]